MAYVHVEVNLDEFGDDDLIEELEYRGYNIGCLDLTNEEFEAIVDMLMNAKFGTVEYDIYQKLRKK